MFLFEISHKEIRKGWGQFRPEVSKRFKGLKLLVTVTVNLRIEVEVSKMKSILKLILSLIS